ncbi:MAG: undecaprenyl-diphosphatase UppP [Actinomycetota bacterium]|nr:undecaprenyl-diphosphatase UppP [Actinomycetota bacterium]
MNGIYAALLGIIQGLTEFLPVSSSAHLILARAFFGWELAPAFALAFDVALHIGTLAAVVSFFRADLGRMFVGWFRTLRTRSIETVDERLAWVVVVATIPAVIVGALGEDWIDENLGEPWMIAIALIAFGLLLGVADRSPQDARVEDISLKQGLVLGLAQSIALSPGTSRSGITITTARFMGIDRDGAARISFLMLVPVTAGAVVVKAIGAITDGLPDDVAAPLIAGIIASAISGYLAIAGLLRFVATRSYDIFVIYRVLVGVALLIVIATGVREATF